MGLDLDKDISIVTPNDLITYKPVRTLANIHRTFNEYGDRFLTFSACVTISLG